MNLKIHHTFNDVDELVSFLDAVSAQIQQGFTSGVLGDVAWELTHEKESN